MISPHSVRPDSPYVVMNFWRVSPRHIPLAITRMASTRPAIHRASGLLFGKLLGTGHGRTFTLRDNNPRQWGLLSVWRDAEAATQASAFNPAIISWNRIAKESMTFHLSPLTSRGSWAGQLPFGKPQPRATPGIVASITRARIAPRQVMRFWNSVPAVSADLGQVKGLQWAVGIGEAPIGLQGTFSVWENTLALKTFAYGRMPHRTAITKTSVYDWYSEELFARFEVIRIEGSFTDTSFSRSPAALGDVNV
ncbi:MAG: monooxygenase [Actinomycetota bacterium]